MTKNKIHMTVSVGEAVFLHWWIEAMSAADWLWRTQKFPAFLDHVRCFAKEAEAIKNELYELQGHQALHEKWRNGEVTTDEYQKQTVLIWEAAEQVRRTAGVVK